MFKGNVVMRGYLKNKKATEESLADGYFHSGDLAVIARIGPANGRLDARQVQYTGPTSVD